jgi:hypothetical protein
VKYNKQHTLLLIEKLERLSNKKVVLCEGESENSSSIFKPLRVNERLEPRRKELVDKGIIVIDESTKTLTYKSDVKYLEYMVLFTFYKNYIIDVEGYVYLHDDNLSSIDIQFNIVKKWFDCNDNKLISLEGCPKIVSESFYCSGNKLTSLKD